ncbi:MAG: phosphatase PAP2 family protein [Candidatus Micrarchaeia archaeon]
MRPTFDAVTRFIASLDHPIITKISYFIDQYTPIFYIISLILFASTLRKENKLLKTILAIMIAVGITFSLKYLIHTPRPCTLDPSYVVYECPPAPDYSFPSGHVAISSVFLAPLVGTNAFPIFLLLNLLVGFSRINLGVHFLNDVLASFVIGFFSYDIANRLISSKTLTISKPTRTLETTLEIRRQALHIIVCIFLVVSIIFSSLVYGQNGPVYVEFLVFIGIMVMLWIINDKLLGKESKVSKVMFSMFERSGVIPGYGAFWYAMGVLFLFVFITDVNYLIASIIALGIGDGVATLVGKYGRLQNPLDRNKTVEGTLGFFTSVMLLSYPFVGMLAIPLAALTAIVEAIPPKFDDNFTIPLSCIIFYHIFVRPFF